MDSQLSDMPAVASKIRAFEAFVPNLGWTLEALGDLLIIPMPKPLPRKFKSESLGMEPLVKNLPK